MERKRHHRSVYIPGCQFPITISACDRVLELPGYQPVCDKINASSKQACATVEIAPCVCILQRGVGLGAAGPGAAESRSELAPAQWNFTSASGAGAPLPAESRHAEGGLNSQAGLLWVHVAFALTLQRQVRSCAGACESRQGRPTWPRMCPDRCRSPAPHQTPHTDHRHVPPAITAQCGSMPMVTSVLRAALQFKAQMKTFISQHPQCADIMRSAATQ